MTICIHKTIVLLLGFCVFNTPVRALDKINRNKSVSQDTVPKRPNANTYWVVPGKLLAGEFPLNIKDTRSTQKIDTYLNAGVTFFIDLTQKNEVKSYENYITKISNEIVYKRMPIKDMRAPSKAYMSQILDTIDQALIDGHVVYVHCKAGIGRTGTVVGAYLVRHGMTGEQALQHIAQLWKTVAKSSSNNYSPKAQQQREFVRKYT